MASLGDLLQHIKTQHQTLQKLLPLPEDQQRKLDKKFRLEFNYNSNHLEGNTLTYGETELLLLFDQTTGDHEYREYEEMKAHDVALKMVEQEAADLERPLTEQFVRSLNKHLLVREFWKEAITPDGQPTRKKIIPGDYKKTPNSVRLQNGEIFHYTAPEKVAEEIAELVQWYNEHEATEDPIVLASLLHYRFVRIHPFDDGNGRVSRLLMNYVLLRKGYPLVVIKSAEKKEYLAALNKADTGDIPAFSAHIAEQVIWSFDLWIKAAKSEDFEEPDDLDKELAILKQELDKEPDYFSKPKTPENVEDIITQSLLSFFLTVLDKFNAIRSYFVSIEIDSVLTGRDSFGRKIAVRNPIIINGNEAFFYNDNLKGCDLSSLVVNLKCLAFKKSKKRQDIILVYNILFHDYQYSILLDESSNNAIKRPYGQQLLDTEKEKFAKVTLRIVMEKITPLGPSTL